MDVAHPYTELVRGCSLCLKHLNFYIYCIIGLFPQILYNSQDKLKFILYYQGEIFTMSFDTCRIGGIEAKCRLVRSATFEGMGNYGLPTENLAEMYETWLMAAPASSSRG